MSKNKQVTFNLKDTLSKLNKNIEQLAFNVEEDVNAAIQGLAESAYASIVAKAQEELHRTRQDYLKGLTFEKLDDGAFLISLDGDWPNSIEDGYSAYNLVPKLLESTANVSQGSRAGQPWVQTTKGTKKNPSHKFAHVPIQIQASSKTSDMAGALQALKGRNSKGRLQSMLRPFKSLDGSVAEGKVSIAHADSVQDPRLKGLVKYQQMTQDSKGRNRLQSIYIAYRTISENGKPWTHPGSSGLKAFDDAEKELINQLDILIKNMF